MKKTNLATGRGGHVVTACFRCLFVIPMLLLGCFGATSAAAQTQQALSRVSLDARDATVITVFQAIQQQTGCSFVYNTSDIDTDRKVSLSALIPFGTSTSYSRRKLKIPPPTAPRAALPES